jgi:predicted MFS family arabinose efflux permease
MALSTLSTSNPASPLTQTNAVWLALACGIAVAGLYYNQPMLPLIGASFGRGGGEQGWIATLTQIGYASGIAMFGPLGDRVDPRKLITCLLAINAGSLLLCASASTFLWLLTASAALGLTAITAQIIIPAVSGLAPAEQRGKMVGSLLSGLFAGQLLARLVGGFVAEHAGWRTMFGLAAGLDCVLLWLVWSRMPATRGHSTLPYPQLMASLGRLFWREPLLREACASGFLLFAGFSAFWATLAFLLVQPPYRYGSDIAGLFGLVSLFGMLASRSIGNLTDQYGGRIVVGCGALLMMGAFGLISGAGRHLWLLIAGVVVLDLGSRAALVANQARLYTLAAEARSRVNTVFMSGYFAGGALGSMAGSAAASRFAWHGVAGVGVVCVLGALAALGWGARLAR